MFFLAPTFNFKGLYKNSMKTHLSQKFHQQTIIMQILKATYDDRKSRNALLLLLFIIQHSNTITFTIINFRTEEEIVKCSGFPYYLSAPGHLTLVLYPLQKTPIEEDGYLMSAIKSPATHT